MASRAAVALYDEQLCEFAGQQTELAMGAIVDRRSDETQSVLRLLARASAAERREALCRNGARNLSSLVRELRDFRALQRERGERGANMRVPDDRFASEVQCVVYLLRRFRTGACHCRQCGAAGRGSWIAVRRCWQCSRCSAQTCIRHGTVFARSHVTLVQWFHAVGFVLNDERCISRELAEAIGIRRLPTVRGMFRKIQAALQADNASQLLAGLDEAYLRLA
jgi:hypothetical protein